MKKLLHLFLSKFFWGILRHFLSDRKYAAVRYRLELGEWPNIEKPQKFTEKIQYIKLYERTKIRQTAADRTRMRHFVTQKVGSEHLIPLIDTFDTLTIPDWKSLSSQFLLKANHGCGMISIVFNKDQHAFGDIQQQTENWKQTNYFNIGREWVYRDLPRTILAEKLLLNAGGEIPKDYKFFCLGGRVKLIQVDYDRFGSQKRNLFDRDFNQMEGRLLYTPYSGPTPITPNFKHAVDVAEKLSAGFTFIRVDLYLLDEAIYVGELTNYPGNGFVPFEPEALEYTVGSWLALNQ